VFFLVSFIKKKQNKNGKKQNKNKKRKKQKTNKKKENLI